MPLPNPRKGEGEQDFVSRCMSKLADDFPDEKQRAAVCFRQFREAKAMPKITAATKLNRRAVSHAMALIKRGDVNRNTPWNFSAIDGDKLLGQPKDWGNFSDWHLGLETAATANTKE